MNAPFHRVLALALAAAAAGSSSCAVGRSVPAVAGVMATGASRRYRALRCDAPEREGTWRVLERDGASREVEAYLSSLGLGESGRGVMASPPFTVAVDRIDMTLRGHDGPKGERGKSWVSLVDAATGKVLRKTSPPLSDALRPSSWEVKELRGRRVRFEAHDHDSAGAFAWLGVGSIDAGAALRVDFRKGIPEGWKSEAVASELRVREVGGPIPFRAIASRYSLVPPRGVARIPCGFRAERIFFLGGRVYRARPLETCGEVEIAYRGGPIDRIPLMVGFTLDGEFKLPSRSEAMRLHDSGDPFQGWFVVAARPRVIDEIRLRCAGGAHARPRITAITLETTADSGRLEPLPEAPRDPALEAWIAAGEISPGRLDLERIRARIRRDHHLSPGEAPRRSNGRALGPAPKGVPDPEG